MKLRFAKYKMKKLIHRVVRTKLKFLIILILGIMYVFGVFTHIFEKDYYTKFSYPLEGDITEYVIQMKNHLKPLHEPINTYNYKLLSSCSKKCMPSDKIRLVYIIKSAMRHFENRAAIRQSWGFESRFSDVPIRTVFLLGVGFDLDLQRRIEKENEKFSDIVQGDFVDTYFNNTIKTMLGFQWAVEHCSNAQFYFFSDDDFYVSTKNVLRFIRNPLNYPEYLQLPIATLNEESRNLNNAETGERSLGSNVQRRLSQVLDFELSDDAVLFSGYVFESAPHRHFTSKWYITLNEYPYHMWPPYVAAGAYVLSKQAMLNLYYGSMFTKHFRFDDIFLGIVAKKVNIEPVHSTEFYYYKKDYNGFNYKYTVASHGYSEPDELLRVWNEQRSAGNA